MSNNGLPTIVENPTRAQAREWLARVPDIVLRGLRRPDNGSLLLWDAGESQHLPVIEVLGLPANTERLIIEDVADLPEGVFADEPGYGNVVVGYRGSVMVEEVPFSEGPGGEESSGEKI